MGNTQTSETVVDSVETHGPTFEQIVSILTSSILENPDSTEEAKDTVRQFNELCFEQKAKSQEMVSSVETRGPTFEQICSKVSSSVLTTSKSSSEDKETVHQFNALLKEAQSSKETEK